MTTALASRVARLEQATPGGLSPLDLDALWTPRSEPQRTALESEADELYYGGAAGGGKTDLLIGAAIARHRRSVVFRREYAQHAAIVDRVTEVLEPIADRVGYNGTDRRWRLPGGRVLELGAAQHEDSVRKWRGRPHDGQFFDELPEFTEQQYLFFSGWARTTTPGQRVRIIGAGNPPTDTDGEWVITRWGPWLDEQHPDPAAPSELRWFVRIDGADTEVEGPTPFEHKGETLYPKSRTFIPARLDDNVYLSRDASYRATLQALPEPLRSQLLYGDHTIGLADHEWQVIPTAWVREAQDRWTPDGGRGKAVTALGIDVAQGGADQTVIVRRHGRWFSMPETVPGAEVPHANVNADHVKRALAFGGVANIDADGIGASTYFLVKATHPLDVRSYRGGDATEATDASGVLSFLNVRAAAYWKLREALDPSSTDPNRAAAEPRAQGRAVRCQVRRRGAHDQAREEGGHQGATRAVARLGRRGGDGVLGRPQSGTSGPVRAQVWREPTMSRQAEMLVAAYPGERFESLLYRFRRGVQLAGIMAETRRRRRFTSPAERKRLQRRRAARRQRQAARPAA